MIITATIKKNLSIQEVSLVVTPGKNESSVKCMDQLGGISVLYTTDIHPTLVFH